MDKEESYVVFVAKHWRTLYIRYLTQGILLADKKLAHQLKKASCLIFFAEWDLVQERVQRGSPEMLGA